MSDDPRPARLRECHDALFEEALARRVVVAFRQVCAALGTGLEAAVYTEALCVELAARGFRLDRAVRASVTYGGAVVGELVAAIVVESVLAVEVRSTPLDSALEERLRSCLRVTGLASGLLLRAGGRPSFRLVGVEPAHGRRQPHRATPLAAVFAARQPPASTVAAVRESLARHARDDG